MNMKALVLGLLVASIFLVGCSQSPSANYQGYNQPAQQGQPPNGQYVGGGCGVAPSADYLETPLTKIFNKVENF